ncbi:MAG: DUF6049 family protein [Gemmatimonadota bacterium]
MRTTAPARLRGRLLALAGAAVAAVLTAVPAAAGTASPATAVVATPVSLVITSVSPQFATSPHGTVTVSGYVTNTTAGPLTGLSIQLWSSNNPLNSRGDMATYLAAGGGDSPILNTTTAVPTLAAHASRPWSIKLKASDIGMTGFGVYPLAVQASQAGTPLPTGLARTFLPYDPPLPPHSVQQKLSLAWVWPLIDTPQQSVCHGLVTDDLAGSIAPGGRLGQLLAAGASQAGRSAQLTWAIDPSLLDGVSTMRHAYRVGQSPTCSGGTARAASTTASNWLGQLKAATATSDFFVTPYADVDVAALSHQGLDSPPVSELSSAFSIGWRAARSILGQYQRPAPGGDAGTTSSLTGAGSLNALRSPGSLGVIAWPANGLADYGVLSSLAVNRVGTVVLDSSMMPAAGQQSFTPSGVTTTHTAVGTPLKVLLTDDGLDQVLATAPTASAPAGRSPAGPPRVTAAAAGFATEQQFLAETAMIVAESPATARSIIVAPPRRWNPANGVAQELLTETARAPWLRQVSLAALAQGKPGPGQVPRGQPPQSRISPQELRPSLLRQVRRLDTQIQLHARILTTPPQDYLSSAVAAVESSAWRGGRASLHSAEALLRRIQDYLSEQQSALKIVDPPRVTLGGKSGSVPVSISNGLRQSVTVLLKVSAPGSGRVMIGKPSSLVTVPAGQQKTIKIPIQAAAAGSTTLTIQLCARNGTPLPGESRTMTVAATQFGTLALVIIGIAFGVFVLTSIGRAIRRGGGRAEDGLAGDGAESPADTGGDAPSHPIPAGAAGGPDTVGAERVDRELAPEESDEHASARRGAEPR